MHAIEKKMRGEGVETTDLKQLEVSWSIICALDLISPSSLLLDRSNERKRENGSEASAQVAKR
jgi:hypothetical protein